MVQNLLSAARRLFRSRGEQPLFVVGVSTWNRLPYLRRFVETFDETRTDRFRWALVVADDGSTDGTLPYLDALSIPNCTLLAIRNKAATIAGQTNSIFAAADALGFDFGMKCDDDIFFTSPGWDSLYFDAARSTGFDHLVFHDPEWKEPWHDHRRGVLRSFVPARQAMGCLYTFTPRMLDVVGYLDEIEFPVRGHAHIDLTFRAIRAGFNRRRRLWDAAGSNEVIGMWGRDDYLQTVDWDSLEINRLLGEDERKRRSAVIKQPDRIHVPHRPANPGAERAMVRVEPQMDRVVLDLLSRPWFRVVRGPARHLDAVLLMGSSDRDAWVGAADVLARQQIGFEGMAGADGVGVAEAIRVAEHRRLSRVCIVSPSISPRFGLAAALESISRDAPPDWSVIDVAGAPAVCLGAPAFADARDLAASSVSVEDALDSIVTGVRGEPHRLRAGSGPVEGGISGGPLVTIAMVATDAEATIGDALTSLRFQTHARFELLVLDNGSTDRTGDAIAAAAGRDPRIRAFTTPCQLPEQRGLRCLMNRGSGEFVTVHSPYEVSRWDRLEVCLAAAAAGDGMVALKMVPVSTPPPGGLDDDTLLVEWGEANRAGPDVIGDRFAAPASLGRPRPGRTDVPQTKDPVSLVWASPPIRAVPEHDESEGSFVEVAP